MDKRWLCLTVLVVISTFNIPANSAYDTYPDTMDLYDDQLWEQLDDEMYDDKLFENPKLEEQADDDTINFKKDEVGIDNNDDHDHEPSFDEDGNFDDKPLEGIFGNNSHPKLAQDKDDEGQIPPDDELSEDIVLNDKVLAKIFGSDSIPQNVAEDKDESNSSPVKLTQDKDGEGQILPVEEIPIDDNYEIIQDNDEKANNKKINEEGNSEQIIYDNMNTNSEENYDKSWDAVQSIAEDTNKINKLLLDYQIEDNRSQVQNKFDEANYESNQKNDRNQDNYLEDNVIQESEESKEQDNVNIMKTEEVEKIESDDVLSNADDNHNREEDVKNHIFEDNAVKETKESIELRNEHKSVDSQAVQDLMFNDYNDNMGKDNSASADYNDNIGEDNSASADQGIDFDQIADILGNNVQEAELNSDKKDYQSDIIQAQVVADRNNETRSKKVSNDQNNKTTENNKENSEIGAERKMLEESSIDKIINSEEDTFDEVYNDLNGDLDQLFGTIDKLANNDSDENNSMEQSLKDTNVDYGFDVDYKDQDPIESKQSSETEKQEFVDSGEKRIINMRQDYYDSIKNYNFDDEERDDYVIDEQKEPLDEIGGQIIGNEKKKQEVIESDKNGEIEDADNTVDDEDKAAYEEAQKMIEEVLKVIPAPLAYLNDGISNTDGEEHQNEGTLEKQVKNIDETVQEIIDAISQEDDKVLHQKETPELTSAEVNTLMTQFAIDHFDDLDVKSKNFDRDVAPVYISLRVNETEVIQSPNYPGIYPANNIVDWIIDGEGMGIEMNVTDFAVNGMLGDYLLVKPGGIDESGTEGLIFSYQLRSERRYRFLDVNRMFIRFQSQPGLSLLSNRGFQLSLKLLMPFSEVQVPIPEPEAVVQPQHSIQVFLGGVSPRQFLNNSEVFRLIVADMATLYINQVGLEVEDVNTTEVTQITQVATCNVNWPGFELCVGVMFGVQLPDEESGLTEDQLRDMWRRFVDVDPFAARLRRMGITEFVLPNDRSTLMVWLVIGAGVAISASMLAFALWRWSCYEEYTRMPAYNDKDSIISEHKHERNLDLYPTPHQTLPPLYDDDFVKYGDTARVDMSGFANKAYSREGELLDLESDDDLGVIPVKQDGSSNVQPKDIYQL